MKQNKVLLDILAAVLILGGILVFANQSSKSKYKEIISHKAFALGEITSFEYKNKHSYVIDYIFTASNNEKIKGYISGPQYKRFKNSNLVGKQIPVIYSYREPDQNFMLLTPDDFKKYKINFPDSMSWILPYLK